MHTCAVRDSVNKVKGGGGGTCELGLQHAAAGGQVGVVGVQLGDPLAQRQLHAGGRLRKAHMKKPVTTLPCISMAVPVKPKLYHMPPGGSELQCLMLLI